MARHVAGAGAEVKARIYVNWRPALRCSKRLPLERQLFASGPPSARNNRREDKYHGGIGRIMPIRPANMKKALRVSRQLVPTVAQEAPAIVACARGLTVGVQWRNATAA